VIAGDCGSEDVDIEMDPEAGGSVRSVEAGEGVAEAEHHEVLVADERAAALEVG
jgi:hypothetical protein